MLPTGFVEVTVSDWPDVEVAEGEAKWLSREVPEVPKVEIGQSQMPAMAFGVGSAWLKTNSPEATKKFKGHLDETLEMRGKKLKGWCAAFWMI